ncbi:GNAT family N-acetyltransferase [Actinosynnema sp. NPDC020468]|uniref:GNAT family N-acetyltransferase n=1 Tax=Actinosynnema sp. NPDC020468 TaxID=3154488 RepID=UPI0033DD44A7
MTAVREVRVEEVGDATDLAARVAWLTRSAYVDSDPVPGLDRPDGADDSADAVRARLADGVRVWTARDGAGELVGCLRVAPGDDWEVHRVAVSPAWRGRGVARVLLAAVGAEADRRSRAVWLNAVVERCLPPLYAGLGFRPVRVFPAADKPLTEWRMAREPGGHRLAGVRTTAEPHLCWFVSGDRLVAVLTAGGGRLGEVVARAAGRVAAGFPGLRLAGVDAVPSRDAVRPHLPAEAGADVHPAGVPRVEHPFHRRPREFVPGALALCRFAPGREPLIDSETPG